METTAINGLLRILLEIRSLRRLLGEIIKNQGLRSFECFKNNLG